MPVLQKGFTEAIVRLNRHGGVGTGYMNMINGYLIDQAPFNFEPQSVSSGKDKNKSGWAG